MLTGLWREGLKEIKAINLVKLLGNQASFELLKGDAVFEFNFVNQIATDHIHVRLMKN